MTKPFLLSFAFFFSLSGPIAEATDFLVTSDADSGANTLRQAIIDAQGSLGDDTIRFSLPGPFQQIGLQSALNVDNLGMGRITIDASNQADGVLLFSDNVGGTRIFEVQFGADLVLVNLEISGGKAPDGADGNPGDPPDPGEDGEHGGAIFNEGTLTLRGCFLNFNSAGNGGAGGEYNGMGVGVSGPGGNGGHGGAVYTVGGSASLTLIDTTIDGNNAGNGGAGGSEAPGGNGGNGGGIYFDQSTLEASGSSIVSNFAGNGGQGGAPGATMLGGLGGTGGNGGGIALDLAEVEITSCLVQGNAAGDGGIGGPGDVNNTGGEGGPGGSGGGLWSAFFQDSTSAHISASLFRGNAAGNGADGGDGEPMAGNGTDGGAGGDGGGIYLQAFPGGDETWKMENTTLFQNSAGDGGFGGIGNVDGNDGVPGDGGGIAFSNDSGDAVLHISHNTILSNFAGVSFGTGSDGTGGGVFEEVALIGSGGITVANSIIALNTAEADPDIGDHTTEGVNFIGGDPVLGPLENNGGRTDSFEPLFGSPVIDAGGVIAEPLTVDQRGAARPSNGVPDIGSIEVTILADARIGSNSNPATHLINNFYSPSGAGQLQNVKLKGRKKKKFYFSVENDGNIAAPFSVVGTPASKRMKFTVLNLTRGGNVTAALTVGYAMGNLAPGQLELFQCTAKSKSRPKSKKKKKRKKVREVLLFRASIPGTSHVDSVVASIKEKKK